MKKRFSIRRYLRVISFLLVIAIFMTGTGMEVFAAEVNLSETATSIYDEISTANSEVTASYCEATTSDTTDEDGSSDIVEEVVDERTENSTTYLLENGNYELVQYLEDVRYTDENGDLVDYDSTLEDIGDDTETTDQGNDISDYLYQNISGDMTNYFPTDITEDTGILLENDDYNIEINPVYDDVSSEGNAFADISEFSEGEGIEESVTDIYDNEEDKITTVQYTSDDESITLEYISNTDGIKENIILNSIPDSNSFEYEINLDGTYPVVNDDGTISLLDKETEDIVGIIEAPYMFDSEDNYSEDISLSIEETR